MVIRPRLIFYCYTIHYTRSYITTQQCVYSTHICYFLCKCAMYTVGGNMQYTKICKKVNTKQQTHFTYIKKTFTFTFHLHISPSHFTFTFHLHISPSQTHFTYIKKTFTFKFCKLTEQIKYKLESGHLLGLRRTIEKITVFFLPTKHKSNFW